MRKIVLVLAILLISVSVFAQVSYNKNLKNGTPGDTVFAMSFYKTVPLLNITVKNMSSTVACSLSVEGGSFMWDTTSGSAHRIKEAHALLGTADTTISDTAFYSVPLKDASGSIVNTIVVPAGKGATFFVLKPNIDYFRSWLTNITGAKARVIYEGAY